MKVKKGDTVIVLKGSNRGKTGRVLNVRMDDGKVVVQDVNIRTIHKKPRTRGEKGEIIKREAPMALSNVAVVDPKTKKPTRVGYSGKGRDKKRIARRSGSALETKK